jgi:hypothetical protein
MTFSTGDCSDLDSDRLYVMMRGKMYPEGEIRGQINCEWGGPAVRRDTCGKIKAFYEG